MLLKTPSFWQHRGLLSTLCLPDSWIYLFIHRLRWKFAKPYTSALPVLCVGGVVAGGSGKTPTVHALVKQIRESELFINPVILTRGYGGKLRGPSLVDPARHTAADVGDEALLHAAHAPTIVSRNRAAGARLAEGMGADLIILDDGLQNPSLTKTLSVLVVDAKQGLGNGRISPAGPLREPLADALVRVAAVIAINGSVPVETSKPILPGKLVITSHHDLSKSYYGFAGLGVPEKFRATLEKNGFALNGFKSFADHHPYTERDLESLQHIANGATLIATEKDYVRLPQSWRARVEVLKIALVFDTPDAMTSLLHSLRPL